jgi:hypothetical protein
MLLGPGVTCSRSAHAIRAASPFNDLSAHRPLRAASVKLIADSVYRASRYRISNAEHVAPAPLRRRRAARDSPAFAGAVGNVDDQPVKWILDRSPSHMGPI